MKKYSFYTKNFQIHTSEKEIKDLFIAWLLISITFSILHITNLNINKITEFLSKKFIIQVLVSGITVGIAFLFHELAHKIVAQKYNCWAEFRADITMLIIALFMSFLGFVFIAPGAVIIYGNITKKQNGIISIAGPLTNIIIAIMLIPLLFLSIKETLKNIILSAYIINAWLALFNMIPLWNFDGAKIWKWNKTAYILVVIVSLILVSIYFLR